MSTSPASPVGKFAKTPLFRAFALLAWLFWLTAPLHGQYAGNYSGTAWGDVDGVWSMTVSGTGSISGRIVEEDDGLIYQVSGAVNASGAFTLVVPGLPTATFGGTIDSFGAVRGSWSDPSLDARGEFEGNRLPAGISQYAGSYSGIAKDDLGNQAGTWTATVSSVGNWDGSGILFGGGTYRIAGIVGATGYIDVCIQDGGTMNGQIAASGSVEGVWYDFWDEGTFTGARNGPEIAVEQPVGSNISDGETVNFGSVGVGSGTSLIFTIKNPGNANLTGLAITRDGANAGDFTVGSLGATSLAAGASTTFTVTFAPVGAGTRSAAIHIASNDADENPFDITLDGSGVVPAAPEIAVEQPAATNIADGGSKAFGSVGIGASASLTFTIRNTGSANLTGLAITKDGANAGDFTVGSLGATTLAAGASTTFTVTFTPSAAGSRTAAIHLASNDADENPFDTSLSGSGATAGNFEYQIADGTVTITRYTGPGGAVVVPATIIGFPVTAIQGWGAFDYNSGIRSISIPASIGSISIGAFSGCPDLTTITVESSSSNYSSLDGVLFNKAQTTLIHCPGGRSGAYNIPTSIASIEGYAFESCAGLTSVSVPASVTSIGIMAFVFCTAMTAIDVDVNNPNYSSQNGVLFNKNLTTLIQYPGGKSGAYNIPASVTSIGDLAFSACSGLTSVTIPASVTSIGFSAFGACTGLTSVTIPASVTSIGIRAFNYCTAMVAIDVDANNPNYSSQNGVWFNKNLTTLIKCPLGKAGAYTIPASVISIGPWAFESCVGLTSVSVPASVTSIGSAAFSFCTAMTAIDVDANNPNYSCQNGVLFNKNLTTLIQCPGGKSGAYNIPSSVTSIGNEAFSFCTAMEAIDVDANNPNYTSQNGVLFNKNLTTLIQCPGGKSGAYTIPASVTSIGFSAFESCAGLTSVTIPASVNSIGDFVFGYCVSLTSVTFLGNAPLMGSQVFFDATAGFTVYFKSDGAGFNTPVWQGYPASPLAASQEIAVASQTDGALTDGDAGFDFGNVYPGLNRVRTFSITNAGAQNLTGLSIAKDGANATEFVLGSLGAATLAAGESTIFTVTFAPTAVGSCSATIHIASNDADENPFEIRLSGSGLDPSLSVAVGIDLPDAPITHGGQASWQWVSTPSHDGTNAAISGEITHNQSSSFELSASGPGTVSFWWKVSSESGFDFLRFFINGEEQAGKISGTVDWQQKTFSLAAGSHRLKWEYSKDYFGGSSGSDCAWVDRVVLTSSNTPQETWRQTYFSTTANTGTAADLADPDKDGVVNLLEYAFSLHPFLPSAGQMPRFQRSGSNLTVTFTQPAGVTGITYGAEWSPTMAAGTWQPITDTGTAPNHTFTLPMSGSLHKFVRLKVTTP